MANQSESAPPQPTPHPALKQLDAIVGHWKTQWQVVDSPAVIHGTDTYQWQTGGFFLLHSVSSDMGYGRYEVLEVIGSYDPLTQQYAVRSFDSQGQALHQSLQIDESGVWHFTGQAMRAHLRIHPDGAQMEADWEQRKEGEAWTPWMQMQFTRLES